MNKKDDSLLLIGSGFEKTTPEEIFKIRERSESASLEEIVINEVIENLLKNSSQKD